MFLTFSDGYGIEHLGLKVPSDSDRRPLKEIINETDYEYVDGTSNTRFEGQTDRKIDKIDKTDRQTGRLTDTNKNTRK